MEIEDALKIIEENAVPIKETLYLPIDQAFGHVCAKDLEAMCPVPAFPKSAMDGYAVCHKDVADASPDHPKRLCVSETIYAGECAHTRHAPGTAARVMTGSMIPEGYDAVVKQEQTDYGEDFVNVYAPVKPFMNYCKVGEELNRGDLVVPAGTMLGRTQIGLLAALGMTKVLVRRPAKIAILSTGTELAFPGDTLRPGQIYNSISFMLKCSILAEKLVVISVANCPDDKEDMQKSLLEAIREADLVITTGGISVGKKDFVPDALRQIGARVLFSKVNVQPGTPTMMSQKDGKFILSLSGNPYAALVNFDLYFWHAMAAIMECNAFRSEKGSAILTDPYEKELRNRRLIRAYLTDGKVSFPTTVHASSVFGNLEKCNCYVALPAGAKVSPGDRVEIWKMRR